MTRTRLRIHIHSILHMVVVGKTKSKSHEISPMIISNPFNTLFDVLTAAIRIVRRASRHRSRTVYMLFASLETALRRSVLCRPWRFSVIQVKDQGGVETGASGLGLSFLRTIYVKIEKPSQTIQQYCPFISSQET